MDKEELLEYVKKKLELAEMAYEQISSSGDDLDDLLYLEGQINLCEELIYDIGNDLVDV